MNSPRKGSFEVDDSEWPGEINGHLHRSNGPPRYYFRIFLITFLVFSVHLSIILAFKVKPVSDFEVYYGAASGIVSGNRLWDSYRYFQGPGYPYFLSLLFQLFKTQSILLPQLFNSLMLVLAGLLLMRYAWVEDPRLKIVGFLTLTLNLNYLAMVPLLCSEILYALFLAFGLVLLWLGYRELQEGRLEKFRSTLVLLVSGISLGVSQSIRPVTTPFLFLLSAIFLTGITYFHTKPMQASFGERMMKGLRILFPVWGTFLLTALCLYYTTGYGLRIQPGQNGLWNLYIGFNTESMGRWNSKDPELISKLGDRHEWNSARINGELWPRVVDRIKRNGLKNLELLPKKMYFLLDPGAIAYWPIEYSQVRNKNRIYKVSYYLRWINTVVLVACLLTGAIWLRRRRISEESLFVFCIMSAALSNAVLHGYILEVQPRYVNHLWMILFWCIPISLSVIFQVAPKRITFRNRRNHGA